MEPTPQLVDDIERSKVEQACRMTPEQKLLAGPELFDLACIFVRAGIRMDHPDADEEEVERLLRNRLELGRQSEQSGLAYDFYIEGLKR